MKSSNPAYGALGEFAQPDGELGRQREVQSGRGAGKAPGRREATPKVQAKGACVAGAADAAGAQLDSTRQRARPLSINVRKPMNQAGPREAIEAERSHCREMGIGQAKLGEANPGGAVSAGISAACQTGRAATR
ncbi:MAG: hypothetical protein C0504_00950 [Candidatus Solibacter sp.]|nr:hypothetical protein [Candidatus Solibacter sp.]